MNKSRIDLYIKLFIICITFCGSIFLKSALFIDTQYTPKQICVKIGLSLFVLYYTSSFLLRNSYKNKKIFLYVITCISVITGIEITYSLINFAYNYIFYKQISPIYGSFDNPAGYAALLSSVYPYFLCLSRIIKRRGKLCINILIVLIIVSIILSFSRTGILYIIMVSLLYLISKTNISRKKIISFGIPFIITLIYTLYNINTNSANGRLFIWKRSLDIIKHRPLFGYGVGGFKSQYMSTQANFFEKNPNSLYTMIADNVHFSYNEFINIAINFGLIGIFFLAILIAIIFCCYKRNYCFVKKYAAMSSFSIILFSFFSYPLSYPHIWVLSGINITIIIYPLLNNLFVYFRETQAKYIAAFCCIIFSILFISKTIHLVNIEQEWNITKNSYDKARNKDAVYKYQQLYHKMNDNPYFLYNYACVLYNEKKYNDSFIIAKQADSLWKNYNTEILLANIEEQRNNYNSSLMHYKTASYMCPAKFFPMVQIQQLYTKMGDTTLAKEWALKIINKPEKIKSQKIKQIKELMKYELTKI